MRMDIGKQINTRTVTGESVALDGSDVVLRQLSRRDLEIAECNQLAAEADGMLGKLFHFLDSENSQKYDEQEEETLVELSPGVWGYRYFTEEDSEEEEAELTVEQSTSDKV